jgi:hypothetical protein
MGITSLKEVVRIVEKFNIDTDSKAELDLHVHKIVKTLNAVAEALKD